MSDPYEERIEELEAEVLVLEKEMDDLRESLPDAREARAHSGALGMLDISDMGKVVRAAQEYLEELASDLDRLAEFVGRRGWADDLRPSACTNTIAFHAEEEVNDHLTDPGPVMDHWATLDVNVRAGYRVAWRKRIAQVVHASRLMRCAPELIAVAKACVRRVGPGRYTCRICYGENGHEATCPGAALEARLVEVLP